MKLSKAVLATLLVIALILPSCGGNDSKETVNDVSPKDIVDKVVAQFSAGDIPESLYFYKFASASDNIIDIESAGLYFYDEYAADMSALTSLKDYAIFMPNTFRVFEVDVFLAEDESGLDDAVALLKARMEQKNNGDIPRYTPAEVPLLESAVIYTVGCYAILLATPDNAAAKAVISSLLKGVSSSDITETADALALETDEVTESETTAESTAETTVEETTEYIAPENRSESPVITVNSYAANNMVIIGGTCAEDAEIIMRCGEREYVYYPDDDNFIGTVEWSKSEKSVTVSVCAKQPDKAESEAQEFVLKTKMSVTLEADLSTYYYICGNHYQFFIKGEIADYEGTNKFTSSQLDSISAKLEEHVAFCDSIGAEVIYLIVPVPMNVYPELVYSKYTKNTSSVSRTSQFVDAATNAGATVIDLTDLFTEHKNDEYKLFHKTDTHWTQYGAYLGYRELMNHISKKWADAVPRTEPDVEFYIERVNAGDMPIHMGIQMNLLKENATFMKYNFDAPDEFDLYYHGTTRADHSLVQNQRTVENPDTSRTLPRAYIMRDSFASQLYALVNDAFSETYWQAMWSYDFKESTIKNFAPDYVIYIIAERNIDSIIG